jgi:hypothetical protein
MDRRKLKKQIVGILKGHGEEFLDDKGVDPKVCAEVASEIALLLPDNAKPYWGRNGPMGAAKVAFIMGLMAKADKALNGTSNDAEHDALYEIREALSEAYEDPDNWKERA